jgi:hypothetical protein
MLTEEKSLSQWRFELKRFGKAHYGKFYLSMVGHQVSNYPRFYKALNQYGESILFEAILSSSERTFDSDPLGYVLKVAFNKWKEAEEEKDKSEEYEIEIGKAKTQTNRQSDALKKRLEKARGRINE